MQYQVICLNRLYTRLYDARTFLEMLYITSVIFLTYRKLTNFFLSQSDNKFVGIFNVFQNILYPQDLPFH